MNEPLTKFRNILQILFVFSIPFIIPGCDSSSNTDKLVDYAKLRIPFSAVSLENPTDCDNFKQKLERAMINSYTDIKRNLPYCYLPVGGVTGGISPPVAAPAAGAADSANAGSNPGSTSGTNNQEAGVNEGDILKVDAKNGDIFVAQGQYLLVVDAYPPQSMNILHSVDTQKHIVGLYYDPALNNILVIAREDMIYPILASDVVSGGVTAGTTTAGATTAGATTAGATTAGATIVPPQKIDFRTQVMVYHYLDDPATSVHEAPQLVKTLDLPGNYLDSRRIESRLHVITKNYDDVFGTQSEIVTQRAAFRNSLSDVICNGSPPITENGEIDFDAIAAMPSVAAARDTLSKSIKNALATTDIQSLIPQANQIDASAQSSPVPDYLSCQDFSVPNLDSVYGFELITSMNTDGENTKASAVINNSWQSYFSRDNVYLAENNSYWYWFRPTMQQMSIHKVALSSTDRPRYKASGLIDGNVGSSFQFSEYNYPNIGPVLRVTSGQGGWGIPILSANGEPALDAMGAPIIAPPRSVNHLSLLLDDGSNRLKQISQIRNIAVNESIYSTRFDGTRAFMVTFLQIDPLFTFDLSDPYQPRLQGALKIPGYISYIHIYDQDHLLTIGQAGSGSRQTNQMQLQLIDVSDMSNPTVLDSVSPTLNPKLDPNMSYSYSSANYDHHAFSFFNSNLLAVPVQYNYYNYDPISPSYFNFSGIMAYRVTVENGFESLGKVDHSDLAWEMYCSIDGTLSSPYVNYCPQGYYVNWASPRRSVFESSADGKSVYLYTVSDVGIKVGQLDLSNNANKNITDMSHQLFPPQRYRYFYDPVPVAADSSAGGTVSSGSPSTGTVVSSGG